MSSEDGGGIGDLRREKWWYNYLGEWIIKVWVWEWVVEVGGEGFFRGGISGMYMYIENVEN